MDRATLADRLRQKWTAAFGYRAVIRRLAFRLERYSRRWYDAPYAERPEVGPVNLEVKLARVRAGGPFEPHEIALLNRAAVTLLQPRHRQVLEVGSGTGMFASLAAADPGRRITASEYNEPARAWAAENRSAANITYCARALDTFDPDAFDLVVAVEVIEHLEAYGPFVRALARVAPEALITTPNKASGAFRSIDRTPGYPEHVREWTAGEFLWVLRAFYGDVQLFTIPDRDRQVGAMLAAPGYVPRVAACSDLSTEEPLLALCSRPFRD